MMMMILMGLYFTTCVFYRARDFGTRSFLFFSFLSFSSKRVGKRVVRKRVFCVDTRSVVRTVLLSKTRVLSPARRTVRGRTPE